MKQATNKFRIWLQMAIFLLAPIVFLGCGLFPGQEEAPPGGNVAFSENYSLNRTGIGTSFGAMTSPDLFYVINATIGYPFSEGISASDNYRIVHTMNSNAVTWP